MTIDRRRRGRYGPPCGVCGRPLDRVWAEMGYAVHVTCEDGGSCEHGESRGPRFCALCRRSKSQ